MNDRNVKRGLWGWGPVGGGGQKETVKEVDQRTLCTCIKIE
jgi:hypothetical protein